MSVPKKCLKCNLYTKKSIDFCPKCGRKLKVTEDFDYPRGFEDSPKEKYVTEKKKETPIYAHKERYREPASKHEPQRSEVRKGPLIIALILLTVLIIFSIVVFAIPFSYDAVEEYVVQEPYEVQVPYTTQEPYQVQVP